MNFLRLSFLLAVLTATSIIAQDYGPVKVDLEGYINDRKLETAIKEEPVKEEPKKEVKKEEPVKEEGPRRRRTVTETDNSENNAATTQKQPIKKIPLGNFKTKKEDPMMMYLIIGVVVLLIVIIVLVIVMLKKKSKANAAIAEDYKDDDVSLADKISAHEQAVAAETTENIQAPVSTPPSTTAVDAGYHSTAQDMADQFARETALDEKGMNQSGLIIDEDKYFAGGSAGFVDEDFSDFDGPHDGAAPPAAPSGEAPSLPPGQS